MPDSFVSDPQKAPPQLFRSNNYFKSCNDLYRHKITKKFTRCDEISYELPIEVVGTSKTLK